MASALQGDACNLGGYKDVETVSSGLSFSNMDGSKELQIFPGATCGNTKVAEMGVEIVSL